MKKTGLISFPNTLTETLWSTLLDELAIEPTSQAAMTNPMTGDEIIVKDPPNLLSIVRAKSGAQVGIVRTSRLFFNGGTSDRAEISFEGTGDEFMETVNKLAAKVNGRVDMT